MSDFEIPDIEIGDIDMRTNPEKAAEFNNIADLGEESKKEIGEQLKLIKEFEAKFKEQWAFDGDGGYFFSICFESQKSRDIFLKKNKIKLIHDDHIMYEEIKHVFKE